MSYSHAESPFFPDQPAGRREPRESDHPQPRTGNLPGYQLILLTDSLHEPTVIVQAIVEVARLSRSDATHKMWEAQNTGRSVLLVTNRERAELFVEQFGRKGLRTKIERK